MAIYEPMTVFTDYLITVVCWFLALRLWQTLKSGPPCISGNKWVLALVVLGIASLAGGTVHGLGGESKVPGLWGGDLLWQTTLLAIGLVSYLMVTGAGQAALPRKWWPLLLALTTLKLMIYVMVAIPRGEFIFAIMDYVPAMLIVIVFSGFSYWRRRIPAAPWIIMGVLVSFFAAGIQQSGIRLHQHFNHNDIYHLIQIVGVVFFYKGAQKLSDHPS